MAGPVKRVLGEARKPAENDPANPARSTSHRSSGAVGPPARIYWARTQPMVELAHALALHLAEENCEHVSLRHCPRCVEGHLADVIAHLTGEAHPSPRQGAGRK